jgi:hypothetical protein
MAEPPGKRVQALVRVLVWACGLGEIIEEYHDYYRCPAVLMLGQTRGISHHMVVAICKDRLIIITVYLPKEDDWINSRRRK